MEKTVSAWEARRSFGQLLREVTTSGTSYVVEWNGQPSVAVVPLAVYEQWKRNRDSLLATLRKAGAQANLSPEEADLVADEVVRAIRAEAGE